MNNQIFQNSNTNRVYLCGPIITYTLVVNQENCKFKACFSYSEARVNMRSLETVPVLKLKKGPTLYLSVESLLGMGETRGAFLLLQCRSSKLILDFHLNSVTPEWQICLRNHLFIIHDDQFIFYHCIKAKMTRWIYAKVIKLKL